MSITTRRTIVQFVATPLITLVIGHVHVAFASAFERAAVSPAIVEQQGTIDPSTTAAAESAAAVQSRAADAATQTAAPSAAVRQSTVAEAAKMTPAAIEHAEVTYKRQLDEGRQVGTALNNLAVLAVQRGDATAAKSYFEKALATDDTHQARYAYNYSKFLEPSDKSAAVHWARAAVVAAPESVAANEYLASLLSQTSPAEVLPLASSLLGAGQTVLANRLAMQSLSAGTRPATEKRAWLILIAQRVVREVGISAEVATTVAHDLESLQADPDVGTGATQLRSTLAAPPGSDADVGWWRVQYEKLPGDTGSGRVVMRNVLLALGEARTSKDPKAAQMYFDAAISFGDHGPDPDAFLRLVELYAKDLPGLSALMNEHQWALFTEKGDAYQRGDWPLIFRLHLALGMTYARLAIWDSHPQYQNAIFQLSHAMDAAKRLNSPQTPATARIALPPVAVDLLAKGYEATKRPDMAAKVRLDGAAALRDIDRLPDSREVLAAMPAASVARLDPASRALYERLRTTLMP